MDLEKSEKQNLAILLIVFLAVNLFFLGFKDMIRNDAAGYIRMGQNMAQGKGFVGIHGAPELCFQPLFPIMISVFSFLIGSFEASAYAVSLVFGTLLILPVYLIARRMYDRKIATISATLCAFHWTLVGFSTSALSEAVYTFILMFSVLIAVDALEKNGLKHFMALGAMLGLAWLARSEAILYVPAFAALYAIRGKPGKKLVHIAAMLAFFALVASPYMMFLWQHNGSFLGQKASLNIMALDEAGIHRLGRINADGSGLVQDDVLAGKINGFDYILSRPIETAARYGKNLMEQYTTVFPLVFPPLLMLFLGAALFSKANKNAIMLVAVFAAIPFMAYPLFFLNYRFLGPIVPLLLIPAAAGINVVQAKLNVLYNLKKCVPKNIALIATLATLIPMLLIIPMSQANAPLEHKYAGVWVKENTPVDSIILDCKPDIAYYGDRLFTGLPNEGYDQAISYMQENADYLVISERFTHEKAPQMTFLLDENSIHPELELVYLDSSHGTKLLIYKLSD